MSRFYKGALSSESESESESSDEEQVQPKAPVSRFVFSDDEEDVKRVVRSEKEKRFEGLTEVIKVIKNHKKIKDMSNVLTDFENLTRAYDKAKKVVLQEGIPRFYIRTLVELEDFVSECWEDREARKLMSKNNAKGLTTLRQKLKKYNRDYEIEITKYREHPDKADEVEYDDVNSGDEDADSDDDDDGALNGPMKAADFLKTDATKGQDKTAMDSDSDDSEWGNDDDESSMSSSDDEEYSGNLASKFLKKTVDESKEKKDAKAKARDEKAKKKRKDSEDEDDEGGEWEEVTKGGAPMKQERQRMFAKDAEINHESVYKKLSEIISARGKKGTDRTEQIGLLTELNTIASTHNLGPGMWLKIMFHIISAIFDYNPNIATCMRPEMWQKSVEVVDEILKMLEDHDDITVGENITEDKEMLEEAPYRVRGCILVMIERMDEEFTKMLQACDAHSTEYVDRLKDEQQVCKIIERLQVLIAKKGHNDEICRVYFLRIKHMYYKFDRQSALFKQQRENNETPEIPESYVDSYEVMSTLCKYIYSNDSTDRIRTRAILCHIYHHALHDRWYEARDLMMMSHLQDNIQHSDVPTQIYYNRGMVQLGLCAFRQGMVRDAHNCLVDIQSGGRAKELLAQGLLLQRQHERTAEQEKIEKRRQMPYHMHINLELLECVYLVSAMLLEIPYMAAHELDARKRMISKNFHHVLKLSERQPLVGPPESMREHVVAASKAMKTGDWRACKNFIINEKMNAKVWDLFYNVDKVRDMITNKIQEESLRTYLFTYSSVYDSICLQTLSEMFELDIGTVHSIISKMIINEELMASLDEPTQSVMMHRTDPTRLQALCLQLSEKVASLVDNNERVLEMKQGNFFSFQKGGQQGQDNRGYQNNRYNNKDNMPNRFNKDRGDNRYQRGQYNAGWKQNQRRGGGRDNRQQRAY